MNFAILSLVLTIVFAAVFATDRGADALAVSPTSLLSVFAIFAAAVLVRLNRGLPTVDWKLVDQGDLKRLLDRLEAVARDYVVVLMIIFFGICASIGVLVLGVNADFRGIEATQIFSGIAGGLLGLSLSRMAHLIWLDVAIVKLQRRVIESSAEAKSVAEQSEMAASKLEGMKSAIRGIEGPPS